MKNPLELPLVGSWLSYIYQDYFKIKESNPSEQELRRSIISSWLHQGLVAPLACPLIMVSTYEIPTSISNGSSNLLLYGLMHGIMGFSLYSIYLRYGFRRLGAYRKRKEIKSQLEERVEETPE